MCSNAAPHYYSYTYVSDPNSEQAQQFSIFNHSVEILPYLTIQILNCTIQQYENFFLPRSFGLDLPLRPRHCSTPQVLTQIKPRLDPCSDSRCFMIVKDQTTGFSNGVTPNLAISSTGSYDEERHFLFRHPLYG
jgi:hypothetical protein